MAMGVIYRAKCKTTGKSYIGQTIDFDMRKKAHLYDRIKSPKKHPKFYSALNKYGENDFEWEILEDVEDDLLDNLEIECIKKFDSLDNGYNCTPGGNSLGSGNQHPYWKGGQKATNKRSNLKHREERKPYYKDLYKRDFNEDDIEVFMSRIKKNNCWIWQGKTNKGSPIFRNKSAQRASYKIHNHVAVDRSLYIMTCCDNKLCVNPEHFLLLTRQEMNVIILSNPKT